ncbi:MAG: alanine--tRNA ligase [Bacteroidota bacterium]|nr:alanine--tRNA ligase [Bacteroidota bacterium]
MTSKLIREKFQQFFASKIHEIVPSAPMVVKDDPALMFTNAGMNQFKDIFLGNKKPKSSRVANSQKCLRVSGKHNDLEEVGHDTYHHTMFEMLGNWSFGDYFKEEAIDWAWEFLTEWMEISPDRLYATVFEGDKNDKQDKDMEAYKFWLKHLDKAQILNGSKKDNFWEMGESGPCGPCSEIHVDLRDDAERQLFPGTSLVNKDHPLVIEIWNLVFIQFNRKANGNLESLPQKHVDTGMGFERLCMISQNKKSNYDTDIFQPLLQQISSLAEVDYGKNEDKDIAMRVVADHLRAVAFAITDGQLPSNTGAGYVIRRILRRAVRYGYTFLNFREPFMAQVIPALIGVMGDSFPELKKQSILISKVITEEETSFLRTLETGIVRLNQVITEHEGMDSKVVHGKQAFELFDTYGFPLDLTQLILSEKGLTVNIREFHEEMTKQKTRSRSAAEQVLSDWIILREDDKEEFIGYDHLSAKVRITRYRQVSSKKKSFFQLVFNITPFYAESGGQVGDQGYIKHGDEKISIRDTQNENNVIIHLSDKLPSDPMNDFDAVVNKSLREDIMRNHTTTHLLHHVMKTILGNHIEQKGSLVKSDHFRFDFSHFEKLDKETISGIETKVNQLIRENIQLKEKKAIPMDEAQRMGATALFGEKYGDLVRVIQFGDSIELCGGTHVSGTGEIGFFKIISEGSIAAGIRRIEAFTGIHSEQFVNKQLSTLDEIQALFKNSSSLADSVQILIEENGKLNKEIELIERGKVKELKTNLLSQVQIVNNIQVIKSLVQLQDAGSIKDLLFQIRGEQKNMVAIIGALINGKPNLSIMITDDLISKDALNAGKTIREAARLMQGGGGGQPFFATAGGKNPDGLDNAMDEAFNLIFKT